MSSLQTVKPNDLMYSYVKCSAVLICFLTLSAVFFRCKKSEKTFTERAVVSGFFPGIAALGDTVTIYGSGFNPDGLSNQVFINDASAQVISGNGESLKAIVPDATRLGHVRVVTSSASLVSIDFFSCSVLEQGEKTSGETWTADRVYLLRGPVRFNSGTLTIESGTLIIGEKASNASLVIGNGATIHAVGSAQKPIVFTSNQARSTRTPGDWLGIALMGGGSGADKMAYVRIEYAGNHRSDRPGAALLLGRGTSPGGINYIQCSYSAGDGFQVSGDSPAKRYLSHLVAFGCAGNDFSFGGNSSASGQYLIGIKDPNFADPLGSDGLIVQTNNPVSISQFTHIGYNGLARRTGTYPLNVQTPASKYTIDNVVNPNSGRAVRIGGYDLTLAQPVLKQGSLQLINSLLAARWLAGVSLDGALAWNAFGTTGGNQITNCIITRTLVSKLNSFQVLTNQPPFSGGPLAKENTTPRSGFEVIESSDDRLTQFANSNDTLARLDLEPIPDTGPVYDDLGLKNLADVRLINVPQLTPLEKSSLLSGAIYDYGNSFSSDPFFVSEPFIGAVGSVNWTADWTNFNPQITSYN